MGSWWKDVFNPSGAEKERYNDQLKKYRQKYPKITFDSGAWARVSPNSKISQCELLDKQVDELKLLKEGKINDALASDGHRVDERQKKAYGTILDEYQGVYKSRYCDPVLDTAVQNRTKVAIEEEAREVQMRVENDLQKQRTIIIAVGGVVLLLGTIFILRKI